MRERTELALGKQSAVKHTKSQNDNMYDMLRASCKLMQASSYVMSQNVSVPFSAPKHGRTVRPQFSPQTVMGKLTEHVAVGHVQYM